MLNPLSTAQLFSNLGSQYFSPEVYWLVEANGDDIFNNVYLPITSQVYSFTRGFNQIMIKESYNVVEGLKTWTKQIGAWKEGELSLNNSTIFERRKDFHGYQFRAVTLQEVPNISVHKTN